MAQQPNTTSQNFGNDDVEVDQTKVTLLIDFGFDRERSCLALKLKGNDVDEAVDLLTSDEGADLATLYAEIQRRNEEKKADQQLMNDLFKGFAGSGTGLLGHVEPEVTRHELKGNAGSGTGP